MLFGRAQQVSIIASTLSVLPSRDIEAWVESLLDPLQHAMELHTYLKHRADMQDVVYESRQEQKEDTALRYNRGVKQCVPCSGYLVDASDPLLPRQQTIRSP